MSVNTTLPNTLTPEESLVLRQGAVALIDALGFRGIWSKAEPAAIVAQLRTARVRAANEVNLQSFLRPNSLHISSFSDTLFVGGTVSEDEDLAGIVHRVALAVASIQSTQLDAPVPLNYRGCISVGEVMIGHDFFVGQPVDDAATLYEQAQAAVVWLTPSTRQALDERHLGLTLFEWTVPLKSGPLKTLVANPFAAIAYEQIHALNLAAIDMLIPAFMRPFRASRAVEVVQKEQNTSAFLDAARQFTVDNFDAVSNAYLEEQAQAQEDYQNGLL